MRKDPGGQRDTRIRFVWLLVLGTSFVAAGCHRGAYSTGNVNSGEKITLQLDWYPQPEHGGYYTALVKGYYKEQGLDVTLAPGGPYVVTDQQVAVGKADFGLGSSDLTLKSVGTGLPVVAIAATMQHDPQAVMLHKDSPVKSFADLEGKTISVKPASTWFKYLVKRFQLKDVREIPATYSVANFIADPQYIQQAFATSEPFFARKAGVETRVLLISDSGYNPYRVLFTTKELLAKRPEVAGKFVRASLRGWREYLNDPTVAHTAVLKLNPALNTEWMQFTWRALKDGHFVDGDAPDGSQVGKMDAERWTTMYRQLVELKIIEKEFDPATAYTLQFTQ
jgi:NitT/TauT family transport system substrate-binding protein